MPLAAQTHANGLSAESVDPEGDAIFLRQIRRRLDVVRAEEKRPTVGLVLSGGGAKGSAQVGALKYIEELGIPIDFICGTSIGGLIGSYYALGYSADEIQTLIRRQDWSVMLTDRIPAKYIPYPDKMDRASLLFTIPFQSPRQLTPDRERDLSSLLSGSLPSGYGYGFNVGNLLSSLATGYQDSLSFSRLPIPFVCVATDIASGKAKYWGNGDLVTAMRSTMSIPGLFDPVRTGEMVLVDGGLRNNFPADVAEAVGADYLIGIELSDAQPGHEEIRNLGDIVNRFTTMLGQDSFRRNVQRCDVFIKPVLPEFNMMSFSLTAIDTMYARGYAAAAGQREALLALRERTGRTARPPHAHATDIALHPVRIASIEYDGLDDATARRMARVAKLTTDEPLDKRRIDEAMGRLKGTSAFKSITFSLYGTQEPYRLVFHCVPAPLHSIGLGLRADSEEGAALLFKLGLFSHRLSGSKLDLDARIGLNLRGSVHYALDLANLPTLNLTVTANRFRSRSGQIVFTDDFGYHTLREEIFVSGLDWTDLDLRAGLAHQSYRITGAYNSGPATWTNDGDGARQASYLGIFLSGHYYTLDDPYFPTRGVSLNLRADYDFIQPGSDAFTPILSGRLDFRAALPLSERLCLLPDLRLRSFSHFGEDVRDGLLHTHFVGGILAGRYFEDQLPFFAFNRVIAARDYLADLTAALRFNPAGRIHLSALVGVLYDDDEIPGLLSGFRPDAWGLGLEAAYETVAGPVRLGLHWSDLQGWGAHLSLGFDF